MTESRLVVVAAYVAAYVLSVWDLIRGRLRIDASSEGSK